MRLFLVLARFCSPVFSAAAVLLLAAVPVFSAAQTSTNNAEPRSSRPAVCGVVGGPFAGGPLPFEPEIQIDADDVSVTEQGVSKFSGDVKMRFERRLLRAGELRYDAQSELLESSGGIEYIDSQVAVSGATLTLDARTRNAEFTGANFAMAETGAVGRAGRIQVIDRGVTELRAADYTTCPGEEPDWRIVAKKITVDPDEDVGTASNARLYFKGLPLLYVPYISFPTSSKRKSGVLLPRVSSSNESGVEIAVPYYWNIAPNMDATFTPSVLTDRGFKLDSEFRYLTERHAGELQFNWLPNDARFGGSRHLFRYEQLTQISDNWDAEIDYSRASDKDYFSDFGNSLDLASTAFLQQQVESRYYGDWYRVTAGLEQYQLLDTTVASNDQPYSLLPRISFAGVRSLGGYWQLNLDADLSNFSDSNREEGSRFDLYPKLSWSYRKPGYYIEPSVGWRSTYYQLSDSPRGTRQSRDLPIAKVDFGMVFEREFELGPLKRLQTLEPRIQYLYVGSAEQDDLPVFDTAAPDFNISRVFAENRFIGADRVSDARRIAFGLTSRFLRPNGRESLRLQLAQTVDLETPEVNLPGTDPDALRAEGRRSDLILHAVSRPTDRWRGSAEWHYDSNDARFVRTALQLGYQVDNKVVNVGYRSRREPIELQQADISFAWPINSHWRAVGRWNYSIENHATLEGLFGLEYQSCCYATRTVVRRHREPGDGSLDYRLFFELELRGLTAIGNRIESILERGILGYRR